MNYVIMVLVNPFSVGMGCLVLSAFLWTRHGRSGRVLLACAIVWLYVWSTGLMTWMIGGGLERSYPSVSVEVFPKADAIHILGGGMGVNTNDCCYAEMWGAADRVWQGARLYKAGKAPRIICSGGLVKESTVPLLLDLGIPQECITILDQAQNTEDEARLIGKMNIRRLLLVTSAWHMRRAEMLFKKNCPCEVIPAAADYEVTARRGPSGAWKISDCIPNAEALHMNCYLFKEHFAYWCYKIFKGY